MITESLIMIAEGEKLNDVLEEVGEESVQFIAQQSRAISPAGVCSPLFALSQQSIIRLSILPECRGVPASTPLASARNRIKDVSHFFILCLMYKSVESLSSLDFLNETKI